MSAIIPLNRLTTRAKGKKRTGYYTCNIPFVFAEKLTNLSRRSGYSRAKVVGMLIDQAEVESTNGHKRKK